MKLHQLKSAHKKKQTRRVGRGISAGGGKTAGRGTKGQKSRRGYNIPVRFEGGQTPLMQRLPKTGGFKSCQIKPLVVKTSIIERCFSAGETVSPAALLEKKIVRKFKSRQRVKILFDQPIKKNLDLKDCLVSKNAQKYFQK